MLLAGTQVELRFSLIEEKVVATDGQASSGPTGRASPSRRGAGPVTMAQDTGRLPGRRGASGTPAYTGGEGITESPGVAWPASCEAEAGRVSCPWIVIAVVFPVGKPLRAEEGKRLGYTVGRCHTWSPAHRTPAPWGRAGLQLHREGAGLCELHPRVELPGTPAPASPRELPRKAELLVKGSRPCASRPVAPPQARVGQGLPRAPSPRLLGTRSYCVSTSSP